VVTKVFPDKTGLQAYYFIITNYNQQDAAFLEFIFTDALHVSVGFSAHHQEHITVHTASGIITPILLLAATAISSSIGLTTAEAVCTFMCS
jgi:hypothetical protein